MTLPSSPVLGTARIWFASLSGFSKILLKVSWSMVNFCVAVLLDTIPLACFSCLAALGRDWTLEFCVVHCEILKLSVAALEDNTFLLDAVNRGVIHHRVTDAVAGCTIFTLLFCDETRVELCGLCDDRGEQHQGSEVLAPASPSSSGTASWPILELSNMLRRMMGSTRVRLLARVVTSGPVLLLNSVAPSVSSAAAATVSLR